MISCTQKALLFSLMFGGAVPEYSNLAENIRCCQMFSERGKLLIKNDVIVTFQIAASLRIKSTILKHSR